VAGPASGRQGQRGTAAPRWRRNAGYRERRRVRVFSPVGRLEVTAALSDRPRRGVVVLDHGWGSRVVDPRHGGAPESYGVNRNLLADRAAIDPLSQTSTLGSVYVGIERV
ncbi:molybdopterin dinucleotide binding domain-containing protein, partial [Streptomyces doebereineriae]